MLRLKRTLLGLALACAAALPAMAQGYPSRPVRLVVPFPPGNAADLTARVLAEEAQRRLNLSVVVENRAGGSGAIGAAGWLHAAGHLAVAGGGQPGADPQPAL